MPNGDIVAAGQFDHAGGLPAYNIDPDGTLPWRRLDGGLLGAVYALTVLPSGDLVAGGSFSSAGGTTALRVARWDGSNWSQVGPGLSGGSNIVTSLAVLPDGELVAGGSFMAGGVPGYNVARWTGQFWLPFGVGLGDISGSGGSVRALTVSPDGELVAGGDFRMSGPSAVNHIARWNAPSATWENIGSGTSFTVISLALGPNGSILAGGNSLVQWDGQSWTTISGLSGGPISAIAMPRPGQIMVGGSFTMAGEHVSAGLARWTIATQAPTSTATATQAPTPTSKPSSPASPAPAAPPAAQPTSTATAISGPTRILRRFSVY